MSIDYQLEPALDAEELASVFVRSGINRPINDLPRLQQMIGFEKMDRAWWIDRSK